jgi:predicted CopG family antitoxin
MRRKLTITVAEEVYEGLHRVIGPRNISMFLETLARPHVVAVDVDVAYATMAADEVRETEALQWAEATIVDVSDIPRGSDETR